MHALSWKEGKLLAADGLAGYQVLRTAPRTLRLERSTTPWDRPIRPGERRRVGWLRFGRAVEVRGALQAVTENVIPRDEPEPSR